MSRVLTFFAVFLLLVVVSDSSGLLLRKGWYKVHPKGRKIPLVNVEYLDAKVVPDTSFLRVGGQILTLFEGSVRNLGKVTILKMSFCGISHVLPGAFVNLPNLRVLALLDNNIEHIQAGVFNHMTLTTLYLQRNQIHTIDVKAFDDMPKLYKLKLNSNQISVWEPDWFHNTPSLTEILFRRNELKSIPSKAFKNVKGEHNYNGTYIVDTKIYLSKNKISQVAPDAFEGLEVLSQLWLDRNSLTHVDERIFSRFSGISTLFLSKNNLTSVPSNMFSGLKSDVGVLDLAGNKKITCLPYNVVSVVKITNIKNIRKMDCTCVKQLEDRLAEENKAVEIHSDCQ